MPPGHGLPDIEGVLEWSTNPGPIEQRVQRAAADLLVMAELLPDATEGVPLGIRSDFAPADSPWLTRRDLIQRFVQGTDPEFPGSSRIDQVHSERLTLWLDQRSAIRRRLFGQLGASLADAPEVPANADELVAPLVELIGEIDLDDRPGERHEGATLTLTPELVDLALRLGMIRRSGDRLEPTLLGRELSTDLVALWRRCTTHPLPAGFFARFVAETWCAALLVDGPLSPNTCRELIVDAANEHGWNEGRTGGPITLDGVLPSLESIESAFALLRLVECSVDEPDQDAVVALTPSGRVAATALLRHQSRQPA